MNSIAKPLAVGALALLIAPCAPRQPDHEGSTGGGLASELTLEVENQNFYDARVYLLEYGRRIRLGSVPSNSTRLFRFELEPREVRIHIDFIGGGEFTTPGVEVSPGDELVLQLTANSHQLRFRG